MENLNDFKTINLAFSDEELALLAKSRTMPITFDPDCPEITPAKALKFKRVNSPNQTTINAM